MSYHNTSGALSRPSKESADVDDSQPPNISYAADKRGSQGEDSDSEEWEEEEEASLQSMPAMDETEWEDVEFSRAEALLFEQETKAALRQQQQQAAGRGGASADPLDNFASGERRAWRLDYDSTYADFKALASMSSGRRSQFSTASGNTGLLDSQHRTDQTQGQQIAETNKEDESTSGVAASLFGTLSNLWSSTFGTR